MKAIPKLLFIFVILIIVSACKKEQPSIGLPLDACDCMGEVSADFGIGYRGYITDSFYELDTLHIYKAYQPNGSYNYIDEKITFEAKDLNHLSYKWKIGAGDYDGPSLDLDFSVPVGTAQAQLIVNGPPRTECFPNDDGVDTVFKTFYVASLPEAPIVGEYYGHLLSDPNEKFTVTIDTGRSETLSEESVFYGISNLPQGNEFDLINQLHTYGFEGVSEGYGNEGGQYFRFTPLSTYGYLIDRNTIKINFSAEQFSNDGNFDVIKEFNDEVFIGVKQ